MDHRWKRSDITDEMVCRAYLPQMERRAGEHARDIVAGLGDILDRAFQRCQADEEEPEFADRVLMRETGAPWKVVNAAIERAESNGLLGCGVTLRSGWLTDKGKALIQPP